MTAQDWFAVSAISGALLVTLVASGVLTFKGGDIGGAIAPLFILSMMTVAGLAGGFAHVFFHALGN